MRVAWVDDEPAVLAACFVLSSASGIFDGDGRQGINSRVRT